jgi:hypothetical protein
VSERENKRERGGREVGQWRESGGRAEGERRQSEGREERTDHFVTHLGR